MEKKWISLYVENEIGVLAKIAGLFSAKAYNLHSLTVGPAEDETISRITIGVYSDDQTYEQIKKQLNRCIEVIKVLDITDNAAYLKELMLIRVKIQSPSEQLAILEAIKTSAVQPKIIKKTAAQLLLEVIMPEEENNRLFQQLSKIIDAGCLEIVRSGSVGIQI